MLNRMAVSALFKRLDECMCTERNRSNSSLSRQSDGYKCECTNASLRRRNLKGTVKSAPQLHPVHEHRVWLMVTSAERRTGAIDDSGCSSQQDCFALHKIFAMFFWLLKRKKRLKQQIKKVDKGKVTARCRKFGE